MGAENLFVNNCVEYRKNNQKHMPGVYIESNLGSNKPKLVWLDAPNHGN